MQVTGMLLSYRRSGISALHSKMKDLGVSPLKSHISEIGTLIGTGTIGKGQRRKDNMNPLHKRLFEVYEQYCNKTIANALTGPLKFHPRPVESLDVELLDDEYIEQVDENGEVFFEPMGFTDVFSDIEGNQYLQAMWEQTPHPFAQAFKAGSSAKLTLSDFKKFVGHAENLASYRPQLYGGKNTNPAILMLKAALDELLQKLIEPINPSYQTWDNVLYGEEEVFISENNQDHLLAAKRQTIVSKMLHAQIKALKTIHTAIGQEYIGTIPITVYNDDEGEDEDEDGAEDITKKIVWALTPEIHEAKEKLFEVQTT